MADFDVQVAVQGLKEFQRQLKNLEPAVKDEIKKTNKALAEIVATEARSRANSRPGVKNRTYTLSQSIVTGNVLSAPTIRVKGHPRKKGRTGSDAKVQEFGGRAPLFGNRAKWFDVRPRKQGGYFLFPAVKAKRDVIARSYLDALDKALRRAR
jgi:hypothetical protein